MPHGLVLGLPVVGERGPRPSLTTCDRVITCRYCVTMTKGSPADELENVTHAGRKVSQDALSRIRLAPGSTTHV